MCAGIRSETTEGQSGWERWVKNLTALQGLIMSRSDTRDTLSTYYWSNQNRNKNFQYVNLMEMFDHMWNKTMVHWFWEWQISFRRFNLWNENSHRFLKLAKICNQQFHFKEKFFEMKLLMHTELISNNVQTIANY